MIVLAAANIGYLAGLEAYVPGAAHAAAIGEPIAAMLRAGGHEARTLEGDPPGRLEALEGPRSAGAVLADEEMARWLERSGARAVLPFKPGPSLHRAASDAGLEVLAAPDRLVRRLENKLQLPALARAAGARVPAQELVRVDDDLARAARDGELALALPAVFQPATGFAGEGTCLLRDAEDVARLVAAVRAGTPGKLVEYVPGEPLTVNGATVGDEVLVAMPVRQLTGIGWLTPNDLGSVGNDWAVPIDPAVATAVRDLARRVGGALRDAGLQGTWGIDAIAPASGGEVRLVEVNPRLTGSFSLLCQVQAEQGLPPLVHAHLRAFDQSAPSTLAELVDAWGVAGACEQVDAPALSTVLAFALADGDAGPADAAPGRWSLPGARGGATRLGDGWRLDHLPATGAGGEDQALLLPATDPTRPVGRGTNLARVHLRRAAAAGPAADEIEPALEPALRELLHRSAPVVPGAP